MSMQGMVIYVQDGCECRGWGYMHSDMNGKDDEKCLEENGEQS